MSGAHRAEKVRRRGRPLSGLLVAAAVLLGATGGLGTFAYWNDVETVKGGVVTAGSLNLSVNDSEGIAVETWGGLVLPDMAPGESVAAALTLRNVGTTPFTVEMFGSAEAPVGANGGSLLTYVTALARVNGVVVPDADGAFPRIVTCSGGSGIAASTLGGAPRSMATTGVISPTSPGDSVTFCVQLTLPAVGTPNGVQGATFKPTFTFTATQVAP